MKIRNNQAEGLAFVNVHCKYEIQKHMANQEQFALAQSRHLLQEPGFLRDLWLRRLGRKVEVQT